MPSKPRAPSADLGLLLVAAIWGINFSVMKAVLGELEPLALNALRYPMAAMGLWIVLPDAARLPDRSDVLRVVGLGLLGNVAYQLCFIFGIDATLAGNASLLLATTPVWTMILSAVLGDERPSGRAAAGIVATLVGMVLVVLGSGDALSLGSETIRGDALMVVGAVLWSAYTVGGRASIAKYGPLRVTAWSLWVGAPFLVAMGLPSLARTDLGAVSAGAWAGVAYAGLLSIALAYVLWYRGVEQLGNNRTAVYSNLVPVGALLTAWLWLGEVPTRLQVLGAVVILGGLSASRVGQSPGPSSLRWRSSGNS